jgi:hypothetical protein
MVQGKVYRLRRGLAFKAQPWASRNASPLTNSEKTVVIEEGSAVGDFGRVLGGRG